MKTAVKKLSDTRIALKITLDASDLAPARSKALARLAKDIKVAGFRKGKVPVEVATKFIPENDLNATTLDLAINMTLIPAFKKAKITPLTTPEINLTKYVPNQSAEYTATVEVLPEIKLANFQKLGIKKPVVKIPATAVSEVLNSLAQSFAERTPVERPAENGDEVVIDFVGKQADVAFPGGTAKNYTLLLGSNSFIPGFEAGIIGKKAGAQFDLKLTFPKDYGVQTLAGQKTIFEITLHQVNAVKPAKLDDTLAQKAGPFKTLAELKADIKKNLEAQEKYQLLEKYKDDLVMALVKKSQIVAPEILIKDQLRFIQDDIKHNADTSKLSVEKYLEKTGEDPKNWEQKARQIAENRVKASLALQALAQEQNITIKDDLVNTKITELKDVYQKSPEALKNLENPHVKTDIKNRLIIEKTLDFLIQSQK